MSQPKRHHWVPRFYLKGFATPESANGPNAQVYIYHRVTGVPELVSIKNIAVKNYLYAPLNERGGRTRDFSLESELAEFEGVMASIWPALATDFVDLGSLPMRKGISLFLATLFLRHPYTYARQRKSWEQILQLIDSAPKDRSGIPRIESLLIGSQKRRVPFDVAKWRAMKDADENDLHRVFVDMIRTEAIDIAEGLMRKRWSVVFMDEPLIVTSDNPLFVVDPNMKRDQLLGTGASLMFPISPTRVLCCDDLQEPGNRYYKLSVEQAPLYNMFTWVNTDDFMISPRHTDDVLIELEGLRNQAECEQASECEKMQTSR